MVGVRTAWEALGDPKTCVKPSEEGNIQFRRSLYVVADIAAGEPFTPANVRSIRPGFGLAPKELPRVLGKRAVCDVKRGTPLKAEMVEGDCR